MTANIISGAAFIVSALALGVSWWYGRRSAEAADVSAKAARDSADEAREVRKAENEREHRDYAPQLEDFKFFWQRNPSTDDSGQFLTFTLTHSYRVYGDVIFDTGARSPLGEATGKLFAAGVPQRIPIRRSGAVAPTVLELRFFPPAAGDPGESWSCPCDRDPIADEHAKRGHWVVTRQVPSRPTSTVRSLSS